MSAQTRIGSGPRGLPLESPVAKAEQVVLDGASYCGRNQLIVLDPVLEMDRVLEEVDQCVVGVVSPGEGYPVMPDNPTHDTARPVDTASEHTSGPATDIPDPVGTEDPANTPDPPPPPSSSPHRSGTPRHRTTLRNPRCPGPMAPNRPRPPRCAHRGAATLAAPTTRPSRRPTDRAVPGRRTVSDTAHDRVWAALRCHPDATAADLSAASGVARSTVTKPAGRVGAGRQRHRRPPS